MNRTTGDQPAHRGGVGRVLDSRWMMAVAVLAVLVAIAWALLERNPASKQAVTTPDQGVTAKVELLGVPPGAHVMLDGQRIENNVFGVAPGVRHALEVRDPSGRSWRQVFSAAGSVSLVVQLREDFVQVPVRQAKE
ncbi:MAG: hypothetical protein OES69_09325 [Myxococcales bacterium]|nr:hypothetical protein [Myxococcales bacterium]